MIESTPSMSPHTVTKTTTAKNILIVITGKGLRSKNVENPYLSKDLSILKYSVPEFIEKNKSLTRLIIETTDAKIEDGGSGAFYIYLKNKNKFKE